MSIVRQPYERRADVVEVASEVPNVSAEHEGGNPQVEVRRRRRSDIRDYFVAEDAIEPAHLIRDLEDNYLDRHAALNQTAAALTRAGIGVKMAKTLHCPSRPRVHQRGRDD